MSRHSITPPRVKFELRAYGEVYDFSNCIDNWKMLEYTIQRDDTSGIFHQISFPFEFVLDAYDVVKNIFDKYQYRAKADMYIYLLKDTWPYEKEQYYEPQIFNLDWTQYNKSDNKIEIDSKRSDLYNFIKAKNKVVYDIPVSGIKEDKPWNFDRIQLENSITFRVVSDDRRFTKENVNHLTMGVSDEASEVSIKDRIYMNTVPELENYRNDLYFMEVNKLPLSSNIQISIDISGEITLHAVIEPDKARIEASLFLTKKYDESDPWKDAIAYKAYSYPTDVVNINWKEQLEVPIEPGDKFYLILRVKTFGFSANCVIKTDGTIKVMYQAKNEDIGVDLIDPKVMLQSLVDGMTNSKGIYQSDIEDFNTDSNNLIMMSAAESIRGIQTTTDNEPKVHTSYQKFVDWMNAYGYEQHVEGDKLMFRKRNKGFRSDLTAMELEANECADLREYVNEKRLYSGLKIGYNRKDIENMNVRFEFNGTHDYSTDLSLGENILQLISPYRADCYGIEFLAQERGKDSTDDKADKDLFLVNVSEGENVYETVRNALSGNHPNQTLFNCNLNPYNLLLLNIDLLGVSARYLQFTASDSNSTIVIDNKRIDESYDIPEGVGLFDPIIYDIASKNIQHLPSGENVNGIVRFKYKGNIYEGFIEEISKNPAWETETTWILRKRKSL